jgi:AhpD family alkylhydroperoxidase
MMIWNVASSTDNHALACVDRHAEIAREIRQVQQLAAAGGEGAQETLE